MTKDGKNLRETMHPSGDFTSLVHPTARGMTFDHPVNDNDKPAHPRDGRPHPRIWAGAHPRLSSGPHPRLRKLRGYAEH